jgi:hypothetical protein
MNHPAIDPRDSVTVSVAQLQKLAADELSFPSRRRYVLLFLVGTTMAVLTGSLLATEPNLPVRTQAAFAVMTAIALAWAGFAGWMLRTRRVLFGHDRVIAATMGLLFSALSGGLMAVAGLWGGGGRSLVIGGLVQLTLCLPAGWMLARAKRRVRVLVARRQVLEARSV